MSHFSFAKALVFVALLACFATSVVIADAIPEDGIRTSHALDRLHAAETPFVFQRRLRSTADMRPSGHTDNFEERAIFSNLAIKMKETLSKFASQLQEWWWRKSSDSVFKSLKLHLAQDELFERPGFLQWVAIVKSKYPGSPEKATKAMLLTLTNRYRDDAVLAKVLVAGKTIPNTKDAALKLLDAQVQRWKKQAKSDADVFRLLKLHQTEGNPVESPGFSQWVAFVKSIYPKDPDEAFEAMLSTLINQYMDDAVLANMLVAGKTIPEMEETASTLLNAQVQRWINQDKCDAEVFTRLKLNETKDKLSLSPVFLQWVAFVKQRSPDLANHDIFVVLRAHYNDDKISEALAVGMENPDTKELALELQQTQPQKNDNWETIARDIPDFPRFPSFGDSPRDKN